MGVDRRRRSSRHPPKASCQGDAGIGTRRARRRQSCAQRRVGGMVAGVDRDAELQVELRRDQLRCEVPPMAPCGRRRRQAGLGMVDVALSAEAERIDRYFAPRPNGVRSAGEARNSTLYQPQVLGRVEATGRCTARRHAVLSLPPRFHPHPTDRRYDGASVPMGPAGGAWERYCPRSPFGRRIAGGMEL